MNDEKLPEEYEQYHKKDQAVHNVNNTAVQGMRLKTNSSNVF
jgi:hypothetical protein